MLFHLTEYTLKCGCVYLLSECAFLLVLVKHRDVLQVKLTLKVQT